MRLFALWAAFIVALCIIPDPSPPKKPVRVLVEAVENPVSPERYVGCTLIDYQNIGDDPIWTWECPKERKQ